MVLKAADVTEFAIMDNLGSHKGETKNLVSVSTAVVATVSALVLGLLISNANTYPARRASDGAIGGNPPARPHVAPIRS